MTAELFTAAEYMAREWPGALALMLDPTAPNAFDADERKAAQVARYMGISSGRGAYPAAVWEEVMG